MPHLDSTGEDRMNSLTIAVIAIAVAQALTILLTMGREREIKKLREQLNQQRLHIADLRAWLAGWNAAQRIKTEREPIREPIADNMKAPEPAITPKDLPETTNVDEAARALKAINWLKEMESAQPRRMKPEPIAEPEPTITPDTTRPRLTEDEIKEAIGDAEKARKIVAVLHGTPPQKIG
jgi:hypothetical protein